MEIPRFVISWSKVKTARGTPELQLLSEARAIVCVCVWGGGCVLKPVICQTLGSREPEILESSHTGTGSLAARPGSSECGNTSVATLGGLDSWDPRALGKT